jgi:flagellar P-ring protein precursor FlgI
VLLERTIASGMVSKDGQVHIHLAKPDFTTAKRVAEALNKLPLKLAAQATSPGVISVIVPEIYKNNEVNFISTLELVEITPDNPARIVVNERTGTVIISRDVRIAPVAVAHAGLHITIKTDLKVSQPNPFGRGQTAVVPDTSITIKEPENRQLIELTGGTGVSLSELVNALNALGVTPRDLIAVFEALREAGALQAELVVM